MLKIIPTGRVEKREDGLYLESKYDIEVNLLDLKYDTLEDKFKEASSRLKNYFDSQYIEGKNE